MKQSVVSVGSQYTLIWQALCQNWRKVWFSFFSTLVISWCYNLPLFWWIGYFDTQDTLLQLFYFGTSREDLICDWWHFTKHTYWWWWRWWWWWWWWIVFVVWLTDDRCLALFSAETIIRDPHHSEYLTRRKQDLNLRRTWVQA